MGDPAREKGRAAARGTGVDEAHALRAPVFEVVADGDHLAVPGVGDPRRQRSSGNRRSSRSVVRSEGRRFGGAVEACAGIGTTSLAASMGCESADVR